MNRQLVCSAMLVIFITIASGTALKAADPAGFHFLGTYMGARPSAMAGAAVAQAGDIHAIYFNPAGLARISGRLASATYLKHLLDFQSGFVGYAQSLSDSSVIAAGISYIDYGKFDETDVNGEELGTTFNANTTIITVSYAKRAVWDNLYIGLSAKYVRSTIQAYSATAGAIDVGLQWHVWFTDDLDIGLAVLNFGQSLSTFIDKKDALPQKIVGGFSKKLAHLPLLFNVNAYKVSDSDDFQFAVGGELNVAEGVFLRFGYDSIGRDARINSDLDKIAGASIGFGFNRNEYKLDYAFSSLGQVGSLNRVTFTYLF